ncbi:hypothetical protein [Ralstonia insidiosa]|uniref:Uncharacterized protein n=1 Tax=Ralstonia insidiosa TaxID=190721 RepID=A0A848NVB6_9RALS|nr:hypothetical protein [Ralstonia insidiosa]NMV37220.1 hypothetical protein [Ralstonia insidiosa]
MEKSKNLSVQAVGIPWYKESDFLRLRALFVDGDKLHPTFLQWKDAAEQLHKRLMRQGVVVVKAYIDPETFPAWCAANGHNVDANGRNAFANVEAARVLRASGQMPG